MTFDAVFAKRSRRTFWGVASRLALLGALATLLYMAAQIVRAAVRGEFADLAAGGALFFLTLAGAVYLAGHAMRILRLALLVGGSRVGFRAIAAFHLMTAAASLAAPLKLGDVYRVAELSVPAGGFMRAVVIAWWERVFDIIAIILIMTLTFESGAGGSGFAAVEGVALAFIAVTGVTFFVAPDNLRRLSVLIIRRYDSAHSVPVLRAIDAVRHTILEAPRLVRGKVATLATLTALIWTCEIAAFALVLPKFAAGFEAALRALVTFLSALIGGETLLGAFAAGETVGASLPLLPYLAATQAPLALLGLGAGIYYARYRLRP